MRSRLAKRRIEQDISQATLARLSGISLRTLVRLERMETDNPPLRYLVNLAIVLQCRVDDLIEDEWLEWGVFSGSGPAHPPRAMTERQGPC